MIGVAVVALFTVFAASIKASIDSQIKKSFAGDLVIDSQTRGFGGFNPQLAKDVGGPQPGASGRRSPDRSGEAQRRRQPAHRHESGRTAAGVRPRHQQGSLNDLGTGAVAVSSRYADDKHLAIGDQIPVGYLTGIPEHPQTECSRSSPRSRTATCWGLTSS